jgi:hypothetical protein
MGVQRLKKKGGFFPGQICYKNIKWAKNAYLRLFCCISLLECLRTVQKWVKMARESCRFCDSRTVVLPRLGYQPQASRTEPKNRHTTPAKMAIAGCLVVWSTERLTMVISRSSRGWVPNMVIKQCTLFTNPHNLLHSSANTSCITSHCLHNKIWSFYFISVPPRSLLINEWSQKWTCHCLPHVFCTHLSAAPCLHGTPKTHKYQ